MMNNPEMQRQFQAAKEMATQAGIGGAVYLALAAKAVHKDDARHEK